MPTISIGLMTAPSVRLALEGAFVTADGQPVKAGIYTASTENGAVRLEGETAVISPAITLMPVDFDACRFIVHNVRIGVDFHWEREETEQFQGVLKLIARGERVTMINELPIESYLVSVISSEMSPSCPPEFLRAHAIVSRSWLLAQLRRAAGAAPSAPPAQQCGDEELIRWYGRESHQDFDVCADDHCQRYQGASKALSESAFEAVRDTRGQALMYADGVCDARYSKCCGGMTESYSAAWEDRDVPYLKPVFDGPGNIAPGYRLPLSIDANAEDWVTESPLAYCGMPTPELLADILPGLDQETRDFYRWRVDYSQDELSSILLSKLGVDFGRVRALVPIERGESGRIVKLRIAGEQRTLTIGKELEIRRALSRSHLYSSAFVVHVAGAEPSEYPAQFSLIGAGWGHGVGMCQIGAAVMADREYRHQEILAHYFSGTTVSALY
jgi:stage II sporulation protein D